MEMAHHLGTLDRGFGVDLVLFDGEDVTRLSAHEKAARGLVLVPEGRQLFSTLTVAENVQVPIREYYPQINHQLLDEIAAYKVAMTGLAPEAGPKYPSELSGGQQQRLCIARSLAVKPKVLLMDEPCSALDPISTAKVEELIDELKEKYTIAIVTHNMQQAARVSDYTAYMYLGEMIEYGDTDTIFTRPSKKETEDYITGKFG